MDAIFIVRMQEDYQKKNKKFCCFVGIEKSFDRVPSDRVS